MAHADDLTGFELRAPWGEDAATLARPEAIALPFAVPALASDPDAAPPKCSSCGRRLRTRRELKRAGRCDVCEDIDAAQRRQERRK